MTVVPGDDPDLKDISGPAASPPADPDAPTKQALKRATKDAARPSPGDRHAAAVDRHLTDACSERDHLRQENKRLQCELDQLRPAYERLTAEFENTRSASGTSTLFLGVAGILVSAASYNESLKSQVLWIGLGFFVCGVWIYWLSVYNSRPRR
jgi:hypothetical protein